MTSNNTLQLIQLSDWKYKNTLNYINEYYKLSIIAVATGLYGMAYMYTVLDLASSFSFSTTIDYIYRFIILTFAVEHCH